MNVHSIALDVSKQPAVTPVLYLGQGDKMGTTLDASIYDGGSALSLYGKSARFCMREPGGEAYYEAQGAVSGNVATFQIDETYAANMAGVTDVAYVEILQGESVICSTNRFRVVVLESAQQGADPAQAWTNGIIEAVDEANAAADDARDAAEEAREAAGGTVPLMTATSRGGAKLGAGLEIGADEKLGIARATTEQLGGVKPDGTSITVDSDGTVHGASAYVLPPATTTALGGVKPDGTSITVDQDGTIHGSVGIEVDSDLSGTSTNPVQNRAIKSALDSKAADSDATQSAHGLMSAADKSKLDGIEANANNYSLPTMSASTKGGAKVGSGLSMMGDALGVDSSAVVTSSQKGAANGVAELDANGLVPTTELPSYVDDVIEGYYYQGAFYEESSHTTPITGETGKIYVDLHSDSSYRWSGSAYISISNPIDIATQQEAIAGSDNTKMMTPLRVKQVVDGDLTPASVTADGEVSATESDGGTDITHNLTEKLDEEEYLAGMTWDYIEGNFTWDDLDGTSTSGDDTYTPNLGLTKPGRLSTVAVNGNMDKLDAAIGEVDVETDGSLQSQVDGISASVAMKVGGLALRGTDSTGRYARFNYQFVNPSARTASVRYPVLVVAAHQNNQGFVASLTLKGDGNGAGGDKATISGGVITVDAGANAWANVWIIYNPEAIEIW